MSSGFRLSRRHAAYAAEVLLAGTVTFNLTACSVMLPVGAVRANNRFPRGGLAPSRVGKMPGHPPVRIITAAGDTIAGRFSGVRLMTLETYAPRLDAWRAGTTVGVPALGEEIELEPAKGRRITGKFAGFGVRTIWLRHGKWDDAQHPIESLRSARRANGDPLAVDSLLARAQGNQLPSRALVRLTFAGRVPPNARGYAEKNGWAVQIPVDDVRGVILDGPVAHPVSAFLGGVALDGVLLLAVAAATYSGSSSSGCDYDASGVTFGY